MSRGEAIEITKALYKDQQYRLKDLEQGGKEYSASDFNLYVIRGDQFFKSLGMQTILDYSAYLDGVVPSAKTPNVTLLDLDFEKRLAYFGVPCLSPDTA